VRGRGADIVLIADAMSVPKPAGVRMVSARTAATMKDAMLREARGAKIILMAAAVSDWRPKAPAPGKRKKTDGAPSIELEPTDDIIALLADAARDAFRVGFALETEDALTRGREKLAAKRLDLVVVNDATEPGAGFEVDTNRVTLLARDGTAEELPLLPKCEVAARILDRVAELRAR
jgi:phosphopantothenoylcysteine decarboxylase/phosphopantothenate--cysteine ligase